VYYTATDLVCRQHKNAGKEAGKSEKINEYRQMEKRENNARELGK